jgi:hypothetical protein
MLRRLFGAEIFLREYHKICTLFEWPESEAVDQLIKLLGRNIRGANAERSQGTKGGKVLINVRYEGSLPDRTMCLIERSNALSER